MRYDRRWERLKLQPLLRGLMDHTAPVQVVNLSLAGAMVEQPEPLTTGRPCVILLKLPQGDLHVEATIAWCRPVHVYHSHADGGALRFRAGLSFHPLPSVALARLRTFLVAERATRVAPTAAWVPAT